MTRQQLYSLVAKAEGRKVQTSIGNVRETLSIALRILGELWDRDPRQVARLLRRKYRT